MLRLVLFLLAVLAAAVGFAWLADRPGSVAIDWMGTKTEFSVFTGVVLLALASGAGLVLLSLVRQIWRSPASIGHFFNRRRHKRGLEALTNGMIAIGAGDRQLASTYAVQARRALPHEPLTHLLRAQAALLSGDRGTSRRIFEHMLSTPETEQLGLRGLYLEAEREGEAEPARHFAERAMALNPKLSWPVDALLEQHSKSRNFDQALETLAIARRHGHVDKATADRKRAVVLAGQAQAAEQNDPVTATNLALEAHGLAPELVPAAAIAGRLFAARGNTAKAAKVIRKTWRLSPHPDLAQAYAYARVGDSPRDRLARIQDLAALTPASLESPIAVAAAAIEAKDYAVARSALEPLLEERLTKRVATLMARIESEEHGDKGRVREWLARAVNAPADPVWIADGVVSKTWAPVSPVTGELDAFEWRLPLEHAQKHEGEHLTREIDQLVMLGARPLALTDEDGEPIVGPQTSAAAPMAMEPGSVQMPGTLDTTTSAQAAQSSAQAERGSRLVEPVMRISPDTTSMASAQLVAAPAPKTPHASATLASAEANPEPNTGAKTQPVTGSLPRSVQGPALKPAPGVQAVAPSAPRLNGAGAGLTPASATTAETRNSLPSVDAQTNGRPATAQPIKSSVAPEPAGKISSPSQDRAPSATTSAIARAPAQRIGAEPVNSAADAAPARPEVRAEPRLVLPSGAPDDPGPEVTESFPVKPRRGQSLR